ncbi:DUF3320 domain-containing protein [Mycolicibacterium vanbaalenii]|uniref:DUF3320 domain-containing protein n=1 Tax=Mycolicibacterium vanbaalenii TaxID=110539 RepID=UPI001F3CBA63|nr:DUF3320 domain-containing protein [Mycolicibacterium vanbaalenii]UJL30984.1 DUF3320 domain-containing protein [Mycolicibacterium vanbaalenii]WND57810.1 DUF3320 domain-containing protein [Mycolicibacterium vanbaalenii]
MDQVDYRPQVEDVLDFLIDGLSPFVARVLAMHVPDGAQWPEVVRRADVAAGQRGGEYRTGDLSLILRAMTERLGTVGYPFARQMSRQAEIYANELREVRDQWARKVPFTAAQALRAMDSAELLLRAVGADAQAEAVASMKSGADLQAARTRTQTVVDHSQSGPAVRQPNTTGSSPSIEVSAVSDLSYAIAHCRIPVIEHITVTNTGGDVHGAVIEVDVVSADGSHGGPREAHLDLASNKPTVLRDVDLQLDPASMLAVDEQRPGFIRVVLRTADGQLLAEHQQPVNILASKQWKATPPQLALEMLAAYVQPNSTAVAAVLPQVSDRLRELTGNSAIDGYQSENPDRVDAIARAVFDTMRARDIRYAEPPASWGDEGQKVRTPAEVLDGRLGTCLDTTLAMAAILEQAGINSTIWVLKGHAFLGYWRTDSALSSVSTTEVVDVVNQVDLGNIGLVETTLVTQSAIDATFDEALRAPRIKYLGDDLTAIIGITDVRQAREARIFPLPSRDVDNDGNIVVTTYKPGAGRAIDPYVATGGQQRTPGGEAVPARVAQWKNALLDLSLRNKLINYTDRAGYRIDVPATGLGHFEDAINAGAPISLTPSDEVKSVDQARGIRFGRDLPEQERMLLLADKNAAYIDITEAAYQSKLRYLANKAKTIVEETGANNLYLAFGMLHWRFNDRDLRSPLVLVPVRMTTKNRGERYVLSLDEAGASTPNYCLLEKLRVALNLQIPGLANPVEDASGIDLGAAFAAVRQAVADAGLHFRVEDSVHLSILQFAKFPLWKDLDESWKELSHNSLVTHLIDTPQQPFVDPVATTPDVTLDDLGASVPVPADSSQLRAVADAVAGKTFVLEGPPGTGKSQTITNLLAHAMASGRRVLFVAEKRAALDVVKKRLEAVGLGELSLDLHDKSARPSAVRTQIKEALELRISHDEDLLRTQQQIAESSRRSLARYAGRLHEKNAVQQSLYSARSRELAMDRQIEPFEVPKELVAGVAPDAFDGLRATLRSLPEYVDPARPRPGHPWGFIDVPPAGGLDAAEIYALAVLFDSALTAIHKGGVDIAAVARAGNPSQLAAWAQLSAQTRFPLAAVDALHSAAGQAELSAIEGLLAAIAASSGEWLSTVTPAAMDVDMPAIHQAAIAADESGFFGRKKRRRAVLSQMADVLAVDATTVHLKTLSELTAKVAATHTLVAAVRSRVSGLPVTVFDRPWNPLVLQDLAHLEQTIAALRRVGSALSAATTDAHVQDLRAFYAGTAQGHLVEPLQTVATSWPRLIELAGATAAQQSAWVGDGTFIDKWWTTRIERRLESSASIECWVALINHLEPLRRIGMTAARTGILQGRSDANDAAMAFDRGVAQASISERLLASDLVDFDVPAHTKAIERFTSSAAEIRSELRRSIPAKLLSERSFNVDSMNGQVGGLRRQLDKKRGGMSVRALMENYGELITQILPCTLMSPDSVARFFPARRELFDVVVFDEASQIRVADAVGAMGRAKSVVVVGDSKQMPPTSFAETSAAVDDEEEYNPDVVVDEESILTECVHGLVPQQWLSWHYRSQDEALIAFSNIHYYSGTLASFPAPLPAHGDHGISFVRVNGHFERSGRGKTLRTNRVEAEAIVVDVRRRFDESVDGAPSLGVITFNAPQRDLIENLLRDTGDDRLLQALDAPDGLFVKNLENVQGDERDTILFSVAFSKNDKGVLPLNFGPLSRPGGERRLNVAVTRARREVVLYASFDPSELRAEETFQIGTKHLKAYLEMAARGVEVITEGGRRQPVIDRHRDDVANALHDAGFTVSTDVGLSEFRVDIVIADPDDPEQPLVAVLLDGEEWFSRETVADRDGLPVDVLSNLMNWPAVERVWLPEWLHSREETIARLAEAVRRAKERPSEAAQTVPVQPAEVHVEKAAPALSVMRSAPAAPSAPVGRPQHPDIARYREWSVRVSGDISVLDRLPAPSARSQVAMIAKDVIEAEAPIQPERLAKLVAAAFGLNRVNDDRRQAILRAVPLEYRREGDDFFWPADVNPMSWRMVRSPDAGATRPIEEIGLIEIGNAMRAVAEESGGADRSELKREALALFGGKRMTAAVTARLDTALERAFARGVLRESPSGLVVAV